MSEIESRIKELSDKILLLQNRQYQLNNEMQSLHNELQDLKLLLGSADTEKEKLPDPLPLYRPGEKVQPNIPKSPPVTVIPSVIGETLENFIGTNLISKIGILITIIGIFIGAKYAIDKNLISPAMRIFLGYVAGAGLVVTALLLKNKYREFSAVLMGGGIAVLYFITYIGFGFYGLFPQVMTFILMVAITAAAVAIALWYDIKLIAILGQVGAYAIPFLLSDGSGKVLILFSYISIINIGLLFLSFRKNWKIVYRIAFFLTWIIYGAWLFFSDPEPHKITGLVFLFITFFIFYATFLSYKIAKKELYNTTEIAILLLNALFFFFFGYYLIDYYFPVPHNVTWFTLSNAVIHIITGLMIYRLKLADHSVYQFITGLGVLFLTVAIPVELDGSWVTVLWSMEAVILTFIAVRNNRDLYLVLAIPMVVATIISLLQDWYAHYPFLSSYLVENYSVSSFANSTFLLSLITSISFGYISSKSSRASLEKGSIVRTFFTTLMPLIFFLSLYLTFYNELHFTWDKIIRRYDSWKAVEIQGAMRDLVLMIYTFIYLSVWLLLNYISKKRKFSPVFLLSGSVLAAGFFLFRGLFLLGDLREHYHRGSNLSIFITIRYVSIAALALLIWSSWKALKDIEKRESAVKMFATAFNILFLAVLCNEFIHHVELAGYPRLGRLGVSIICGLYALVLIFTGIRIRQKHLRISAIFLFGLTLIKLFFYDLAGLSTVSKTILLVILGLILLVVSFLYNKYKELIFGEDE